MILKIVKKVDKQIEIKKLYNFLNNFIVTALISPLFLMTIINIITTKEGKEQEIALGLKEEYYGDKEKIKECSNL